MSTAAASSSSKSVGMAEYSFIIIGMTIVQVLYAVFGLIIHRLLLLGLKSLPLVIFSGFAGSTFLVPFALVLERIVFQLLMIVGMEMTSPALAAAMPNLAPVFTL